MATNTASDGSKSKEFSKGSFHAAHSGQKCSRWQHGDNPPKAVKCRESGGRHLGACAEHAKQMTKNVNLAEAVFLSNRRTPEIVSDGAKSKKAGGKAGHVVSRRKLNAKEREQMRKGKWIRVRKDGKKPGDKGYLSGPSKGPDANRKKNTNLSDSDELFALVRALKVHGHKYSAEQVATIKSRIRGMAATINLANDDQASDFGNNATGAGNNNDGKKSQAGKTRAQPRAFGGRFGKKGKSNGEQAMPGTNQTPQEPTPDQFIATANNLQIGQSFALPNNSAKVKRLGRGYQLYKMDGSLNKVVKTLPEVHSWIKSMVKGGANDSNQPAA